MWETHQNKENTKNLTNHESIFHANGRRKVSGSSQFRRINKGQKNQKNNKNNEDTFSNNLN